MHRYQKQKLLFFVAQDVSDGLRASIGKLVENLAVKRSWVIAPPELVDELDDAARLEGDSPDVTVGGGLLIFSANDSELPRDLDLRSLQEVEYMVAEIRAFSESSRVSIEFELDGQFVGAIDRGRLDKTLSEGLLGEWRRHLGV